MKNNGAFSAFQQMKDLHTHGYEEGVANLSSKGHASLNVKVYQKSF